jgi:hypothetical protein
MASTPHRSSPASRRPAQILWLVLSVETLLCLAHVYWHLTWRGRAQGSPAWMKFTDMRWDAGPYQWGTILTTLLVGITGLRLAAICAPEQRRGWLLVGGLFTYLAIDDALCIHEWMDGFVERNLTEQRWVNPWLIVLVPVFGILGALALRFLHREMRPDRRRWLLTWAAFLAMGMAIVFEVVERQLGQVDIRLRGFPLTDYTQVVEEYLEMLAPALLSYCLGSRLCQLRGERSSGDPGVSQ